MPTHDRLMPKLHDKVLSM